MNSRSVFVRIGWMRFYQGVQANDPKPIGGGAYNKENVGHEAYNFKLLSGKYYGYFQPPRAGSDDYGKRVVLKRIVSDNQGSVLEGVTIVFVSRRKLGQPQVVVGWYDNARLYGEMQESNLEGRERFGFLSSTSMGSAVLLPTDRRVWTVPWGNGGMGQSNICYPLESNGTPKDLPWWENILRKIEGYDGPNLLGNELLEQEEYVASVSGRQGFGLNVAERKVVELYAMKMAMKHFRERGFEIEDTSASKPYDLLCRKGGETLYVEVKGSTGTAESIFLTKNEVKHARSAGQVCSLFVVSYIELNRVRGKLQAHGGVGREIHPWVPSDDCLEALQYSYDVSKHTVSTS